MAVLDTLRGAWRNAFRVEEERQYAPPPNIGPSYAQAPDRIRIRAASDRSTLAAIYNRIANDFAGIDTRHVRVDENRRYLADIDSGLNDVLTFETNIDQAPRNFRQDMALTLFDEGSLAVVPIDTLRDDLTGEMQDILSMRVGRIVEYFPQHIKVNVFNEATGLRQDILVKKRDCAIVHNPFYAVMNELNSTLQRLNRKLGMLDYVDEQSSSGKLDLIVQLPYVIKGEARKQQAEQRQKDIADQLRGTEYGIAYTDGTEKITQLNRPVENNLQSQVEGLIEKLYGELGITAAVMNGTADEATMVNYYNRTVYPLVEAVVEAMQRAFIGAARTKANEMIFFTRATMDFLTLKDMGEVVDKLSRNEVVTANEIRGWIGMKPSTDPKAEELINSNMPQPDDNADPAES